MLGDKSIVGTLEECEVKLLADYKSDLEVFDASEHKAIFSELLPEQHRFTRKFSVCTRACIKASPTDDANKATKQQIEQEHSEPSSR